MGKAPGDLPMNRSPMTRRSFLATSAAGVAAVPALGQAPATQSPAQPAQPAQGEGFGPFLVGCQSYTFRSFNRERAITSIAQLGMRFVEFYNGHVPLNSTEAQINAIRRL